MDSKEEVELTIEEGEEDDASTAAAAENDEAEVNEETNEEMKESEIEEEEEEEEEKEAKESEKSRNENPSASRPSIEGASPGKIFVGGLPKDTTDAAFTKHFEKYGKIVDSVIMKHRGTGHPRGFGFITFEDPSAVEAVILDPHIFDGKQVEIKRTIPKGAISGRDFKTKKIFVGGIPTTVDEDELKKFFSKFGEVEEHLIMRDHTSGRSRGFGFVSFSAEKVVDELLTKGNKIDFAGTQVEIKKAEPKKTGHAPAPPLSTKHYGNPRPSFGRGGGFKDRYNGSIGSAPYRYGGGGGFTNNRPTRGYGGYAANELDVGYGSYGGMGTGIGSYRGDSSLGFSARYGGGLGRGYGFGGYNEPSESYGRYGGVDYGGGYDAGPGVGGGYAGGGPGGYAGGGAGLYGARRDYGGAGPGPSPSGRYHPYSRS